MPIVDIEVIGRLPARGSASAARALADALGRTFATPPGRTWVRLRVTPASRYAENGIRSVASELPVFVTVLHAHPPRDSTLAAEIAAVTQAVAAGLGRPPERVHVQYAPPGAGRQAFGGTLVT